MLPPKASALFCTTRSSASTASLGTQSTPHSGSVSTWLMVGGTNPSVRASAQAAAARALAAPMVWPIMDLMETVRGMSAPNTWRIAPASVMSLALVPVPCAEMKSTSFGAMPASRCAAAMHRAMLSRSGATGWWASQLSP